MQVWAMQLPRVVTPDTCQLSAKSTSARPLACEERFWARGRSLIATGKVHCNNLGFGVDVCSRDEGSLEASLHASSTRFVMYTLLPHEVQQDLPEKCCLFLLSQPPRPS
eukprot:6209660-Pleurochrysis_carterae.AAC.1